MNEELEFLDLGNIDLEEVYRKIGKFHFPVVTVGDNVLYFNKYLFKHFGDMNYIRFYTSPEYIILEPLSEKKMNSFAVHRRDDYGYGNTIIPAELKEKKLAKGFYKAYKCSKGIAFKRYEPITEEAS